MLRFLARKYEFRGGGDEEGDERAPLEAIVNATFPVLLQIFQVCVWGGPGRGGGTGAGRGLGGCGAVAGCGAVEG